MRGQRRGGSRRPPGPVGVMTAAAFTFALSACSRPSTETVAPNAPGPSTPTAGAATAPVNGVTRHDPSRVAPGYLLTLDNKRTPVLLDMNGVEVHRYPNARLKSRVHLQPDGAVLGIGLGRQVTELSWDGRVIWEFETPNAIPHHDVIRLRNGNTLVLVLVNGETADTLYEVNRAGEVVWTWRALDHLGALLPAKPEHPNDITHINSLQELPENPWWSAGDARFRPGNLLLSARNLDTILIVDRDTSAVVWSYRGELDKQHEALMNGPDHPRAGMILLFDNRPRSFRGDRQSQLLELDPRDGTIGWRYTTPGFFSPTAGVAHGLANGNVVVTSTRGGRVFEVTRDGEMVWEWVPPYEPIRAAKVALDACPQLAALTPPVPVVVVPPPDYIHVDVDAYRFARQGSRQQAMIAGEKRVVLSNEDDCRELLLPMASTLAVSYGVDPERLRAAGRDKTPPRFSVTLRPRDQAAGANAEIADAADAAEAVETVELLADTVSGAEEPWRTRSVDLARWSGQWVELCVAVDDPASAAAVGKRERYAYFAQPTISTGGEPTPADEEDQADAPAPADLTPEELEVRLKHLKALGYVD